LVFGIDFEVNKNWEKKFTAGTEEIVVKNSELINNA
jgi:hypothetical protein